MSLPSPLFHVLRLPLLVLGIVGVGLLGCGDSGSEETKTPKTETAKTEAVASKEPENSEGPQRPDQKRGVNRDPKGQLQADLEEAISLLEKGEVATFIEYYMPLEFVYRLRTQPTAPEVAQPIEDEGRFQEIWLEKLRSMRKAEIVFFDEHKSLARLEMEPSSEDLAPPELDVIDPAEEKIPVTDGFAGSLQEAIAGAIAALEAKEYQKFIENMFPPSELYLTKTEESMRRLLLRLEEHPQMAGQMLADLKALQKLKPEMDKQQTTATFQLNAGTKQARTVRLEKQETWRFANTANEVRTEVSKQARQLLPAAKLPATTEWIRIREHWRLSRIN